MDLKGYWFIQIHHYHLHGPLAPCHRGRARFARVARRRSGGTPIRVAPSVPIHDGSLVPGYLHGQPLTSCNGGGPYPIIPSNFMANLKLFQGRNLFLHVDLDVSSIVHMD